MGTCPRTVRAVFWRFGEKLWGTTVVAGLALDMGEACRGLGVEARVSSLIALGSHPQWNQGNRELQLHWGFHWNLKASALRAQGSVED